MNGNILFLLLFILVCGAIGYGVFSTRKAISENHETWLMKFWKKDNVKVIAASLISIIIGMIIGCILLLIFAGATTGGMKNCFDAMQLVILGPFNIGRNPNNVLLYGWNGTNIGNVLFNATPVILTGLSVALAFKTGLFNIGTPGQYLMGTAATLIVALSIPTTAVPAFLVWILAFLAGILAGAVWGAIPGIFKAYLNVNEVITCIMMNWIAANVVTILFDKTNGPFKTLLDPSGTKNWAYVFKTTHNNVVTPKFGLDVIFEGSQVNGGIIIALIIAILIHIILNKTTFGYQLKACGSNRNAARYAGINDKVSTIVSMAIAGGLAGAGAALYYLSGNTEFAWETYQTLPAVGFNGIPVALLASNNPIGTIFAAIFMALLDVNGMQLKYQTPYNEHITSIIAAIIVYFSAFALIFKQLLDGKIKIKNIFKKENKEKLEPVIMGEASDQTESKEEN